MSAYERTVEADLTNPLGKSFYCIGRPGQELKSKEYFDFHGFFHIEVNPHKKYVCFCDLLPVHQTFFIFFLPKSLTGISRPVIHL